jgi:hypothetical protein
MWIVAALTACSGIVVAVRMRETLAPASSRGATAPSHATPVLRGSR